MHYQMSRVFFYLTCLSFLGLTPVEFEGQLPSYLPSNGLVGWWTFNGNANDESGNGNNGVVNGATLTEDRFGNANATYSFNGSSDFIEVPYSSSLQFTNSFSINCWTRINDLSANERYYWKTRVIVGKPRSSQGTGFNLFSINENVPNYGGGMRNSYPDGYSVEADDTLGINEWTNLTLTYDGGTLKIYKNGILKNQQNCTLYLDPVELPIFFGKEFFGEADASRWFKGQIDDIAIYNRGLTQAEVAALYTATATNTVGGTTSTTAPPGIPYQAEVRSESGEVLANANVNVRFTLHELTANGTISYQETHTVTTNELGLFAATIGGGTATQGTFAGINWSHTTKFLQVEVDTGNGYITMGNQQLMSVPYALYAANGPVGPQGPAGPQGLAGEQGAQGAAGTNGADGVGIASVTTSGSNLVITLTNGQIQTVPFPTAPSSTTGSNANTLIYTVNGF
jgi:hypothetical protein